MSDDAIERLRRENPFPQTLPAPAIEPVLARLAGRRPGSLSRPRLAFGRVAVAAGVAAAVVVAVLALALVGHRQVRPPVVNHPGPPPSQATLAAYLNAAYQATIKRDPACSPQLPSQGITSVSDGAPSRALLSAFGVLRRPATAADRLSASDYTGRRPLQIVYVRYIRRARVVHGVSYYLIPGRATPPPFAVPLRCFSEQRAALQTVVASLTADKRMAIIRAATQMLARERRARLELPTGPYPGVELLGLGYGGGSDCCVGASRVPDQVSIGLNGTIASGIVPDSVTSVSLYYTKSSSQNVSTIIATATRVVTAPVIDNVYVVNVGSRGRPEPSAVVYRTASGAVLKGFDTNQ